MLNNYELQFEGIYDDLIMDHYRNPRNRNPINRTDIEHHDWNPFCGDEVDINIAINEDYQIFLGDKYKAEDSVEVGNIYRGESYYELVVGIKGDNVFTKRIDIKDGNQYDINQMHKELSHAGNIDFEVLNEIL